MKKVGQSEIIFQVKHFSPQENITPPLSLSLSLSPKWLKYHGNFQGDKNTPKISTTKKHSKLLKLPKYPLNL
jgi:hypothetical protein